MGAYNYIKDFLSRGGASVFISTAVVKFCAAILSIVVVRLLDKDDYGILAYALSIYGIGIVISGFGSQYSLLRYGSLLKSHLKRRDYYRATMNHGVKYTAIICLFVIVSAFFPFHPKGSSIYLILTGISLISFFIIELQRSYFRILDLNRLYSRVNVVYSVAMLIAVILLSWLIGGVGYMLAYIIMPIIVFFFFNRNHYIYQDNKDLPHGYWSYGLHTSLGSVANQVVFSIAPFLLGLLATDESSIADFKVATIIPFNLLTLPGILMITDFNYLSRNYQNKRKIIEYYKNYLKVIIPAATLVFIPLIIWGKAVIVFLFGDIYEGCYDFYVYFMIATYITFFFRNPLGNILLAVGKAAWNGYNSYAFAILYVAFTFVGYKYWGVYSAVFGLSLTFVLSGFVSLALFIKYLKEIDN